MVRLATPAEIRCDEPSCGKAQIVSLVLTPMGGFVFYPYPKGWQVVANPNNPADPFLCRCEKHAQHVVQASMTPKLIGTAH